ncbi:MAG: DEAD/DEAH box helicase, partial [Candidatus Andersenbacteria bacterium]|nr:DEAD/DEAH box helicase [Candidatus Andersenbacteria bacterium]
KSLEGRKYNPATKSWFIPLAGGHAAVERLAKRGFAIDPSLWEEVRIDQEQAREAEALAILPDTEFKTTLPLFPYQKVGSAFLWKIGSGLIGDEMGLGKTIMALAVCEKVQAQKVLIFTPAAVKWQWAQEIAKFVKTNNSIVIEGDKKTRLKLWRDEQYQFYIANYELLLRDLDSMDVREWDVIIADEATRISNPQAKQSRAIKKLRAKRRIAMTGTPVSNRANEVWNIIDFCQPGAFGNYYSFLQRYCLKNQWGGIFGYQHMDELRGKLKRYMIRRLKADVLPELPAKICTDIPFELTEEEKALYKKLKKEILFEIEARDIAKIETPMTISYTLVKMLRLRQLADSMELLGHNVQSSKLAVLKELLIEALDNSKKAIVFTQFSEMADILERELAEWLPLKISGKVIQRQDIVSAFNENDINKVLIMTSAGQFGLNIQRASVIFHYDQEWSLAKMGQREGRAHRIGQKDIVLVYNLLAKGTLDYYVKKVLHAKAELSNQILGDTPISMGEIKEMLTYEN